MIVHRRFTKPDGTAYGHAIHGSFPEDVLEVAKIIKGNIEAPGGSPEKCRLALTLTDPPFGNIVPDHWDKVESSDAAFAQWMVDWTNKISLMSLERSALYVFGGIGTPNFRPFYRYIVEAEIQTPYKLANHITWSKKRGYGIQHNYLFTREELAYLHLGDDIRKPRVFNVPLLDAKRGYAGYDKNHPAKSEFFRRTSVWRDIVAHVLKEGAYKAGRVDVGQVLLDSIAENYRSDVWEDITEILRGKLHTAQKPERLMEIPIEVHTHPGEWVFDPFAGSGTTALAAMKLGRSFIVMERDPVPGKSIDKRKNPDTFGLLVKRIEERAKELEAT